MKTQSLLFRVPVVMLSLLLMIAYVYTRSGGEWPKWSEPEVEVQPLAGPEAELRAATRARQIAAENLLHAMLAERKQPGSIPRAEIETLEDVVQWLDGQIAGLRTPATPSAPPATKPALLPGSKSKAVFTPALEPLPASQPKPELFPGSKSAVVFPPVEGRSPAPSASTATPPRELLPGSKSDQVQLQPRRSTTPPNAPPRQTTTPVKAKSSGPGMTPPKAPAQLLPGSKSFILLDPMQVQQPPLARRATPNANPPPAQQSVQQGTRP